MGWLRWVLIAVAVLLVLVVGTLALLPQLLDTPTMQGYIAQTASHAVGRPVKFTSVSVSLLPLPHVNLKGLEIADDPRFGTTPLLRVGEVRVGVRVKPLLSLRIEVGSVTLQDAQVELVERGGRWNFAALSAAPAPAKPATRTVPGHSRQRGHGQRVRLAGGPQERGGECATARREERRPAPRRPRRDAVGSGRIRARPSGGRAARAGRPAPAQRRGQRGHARSGGDADQGVLRDRRQPTSRLSCEASSRRPRCPVRSRERSSSRELRRVSRVPAPWI